MKWLSRLAPSPPTFRDLPCLGNAPLTSMHSSSHEATKAVRHRRVLLQEAYDLRARIVHDTTRTLLSLAIINRFDARFYARANGRKGTSEGDGRQGMRRASRMQELQGCTSTSEPGPCVHGDNFFPFQQERNTTEPAWDCMGLHGTAMDCMGLLWTAWACYGLHGLAMAKQSFAGSFAALEACTGLHGKCTGLLWDCSGMHGPALSCMGLHGLAWACTGMHGHAALPPAELPLAQPHSRADDQSPRSASSTASIPRQPSHTFPALRAHAFRYTLT
jgi:hypothetical protein